MGDMSENSCLNHVLVSVILLCAPNKSERREYVLYSIDIILSALVYTCIAIVILLIYACMLKGVDRN